MAKNFSRSNAIQVIRRDELEEIIREIINDSTASADAMVTEEGRETLQGEIMNSDIEAMLGNLELFQLYFLDFSIFNHLSVMVSRFVVIS